MTKGSDIADMVMYYMMGRFNLVFMPSSPDFIFHRDAFLNAYGSIMENVFELREELFSELGKDPELYYRNIITMHVCLKKIYNTMPIINCFSLHEQPRILIRTCSMMALSILYFIISGVPFAMDKGHLYIASAADQVIGRSYSLINQPLVTLCSDYYNNTCAYHDFGVHYAPYNALYPMARPHIEPTADVVLQLPEMPEDKETKSAPVTPNGSSSKSKNRRKVKKQKKLINYRKTI